MVEFYAFHVGKYTSPMDGMGIMGMVFMAFPGICSRQPLCFGRYRGFPHLKNQPTEVGVDKLEEIASHRRGRPGGWMLKVSNGYGGRERSNTRMSMEVSN